jgi:recombination protein RecA
MAKKKLDIDSSFAGELLASVNQKFKSEALKPAYYLDDPAVISDVQLWVPSGSSMLDLAISNRKAGGFPVGRITEVTGLEASGKSLLVAHAIANTQKLGGIGIFIDTEAAVSKEFFESIGVNVSEMLYLTLETMEDIFTAIDTIMDKVRTSGDSRLITIIVDSVMGASTKIEMEADYDKDGWSTTKAIVLSKGMRKLTNQIARQKVCLIFTNQLRTKLGVSFGDPYTTSGGKALGFHSSVRLRLKKKNSITLTTKGIKQIVGVQTQAQVIKNRLGPPLKTVEYDIYFDSGIDDYGSWLTILKQYSIASVTGAWYSYDFVDKETGDVETIKFQSKDFRKLLDSRPELKDDIYEHICDKFIMKYKINEDYGVDDVVMEDEFISED